MRDNWLGLRWGRHPNYWLQKYKEFLAGVSAVLPGNHLLHGLDLLLWRSHIYFLPVLRAQVWNQQLALSRCHFWTKGLSIRRFQTNLFDSFKVTVCIWSEKQVWLYKVTIKRVIFQNLMTHWSWNAILTMTHWSWIFVDVYVYKNNCVYFRAKSD